MKGRPKFFNLIKGISMRELKDDYFGLYQQVPRVQFEGKLLDIKWHQTENGRHIIDSIKEHEKRED